MYQERLAYCKNMTVHAKASDRHFWKIAEQIYEHLINCSKAHSIHKLKQGITFCKELIEQMPIDNEEQHEQS